MIQVFAELKYVRISCYKARLISDQIRGLYISKALKILTFSKKKSAFFIKNVLNSAISNAEHNFGMNIGELYISKICIEGGPTMKRFISCAKGRGNRILKRTSHILIGLSENKN